MSLNSYIAQQKEDSLLILLFHGVIARQQNPIRNYTSKHLTQDRFIQILKQLKTSGATPLSMNDVLQCSKGIRSWPERPYAITFDDGFENNYLIAAPILEEMKIPATFYVTTSFIEENASSWIDQIEYAVEKRENVQLDLSEIGAKKDYRTREEKISLLALIRQRIKFNPQIDPYNFASKVLKQLQIDQPGCDKDLDQKMSWVQIQALENHPLFTIGGHGHTHRILSYLDEKALNSELDQTFQLLKRNLKKDLIHFSYPEGLKFCYSDVVIKALRSRGIQCCPSAEEGINTFEDDLFQLKRVVGI